MIADSSRNCLVNKLSERNAYRLINKFDPRYISTV